MNGLIGNGLLQFIGCHLLFGRIQIRPFDDIGFSKRIHTNGSQPADQPFNDFTFRKGIVKHQVKAKLESTVSKNDEIFRDAHLVHTLINDQFFTVLVIHFPTRRGTNTVKSKKVHKYLVFLAVFYVMFSLHMPR